MHLGLVVRVEQLQQHLAHQQTRLIRGHVALDVVAAIDADVVLGRLEDGPVLVDNRPVPGDELCGRAVGLGIVAVEPLGWRERLSDSSVTLQ